ncbi:hypothetical protein EG829_30670, partial [bacterium]|nr:hypothetical protein [bacterium]
LWDVANRRLISSVQGHLHEVWSIAIAPDGKNIASGSKYGGLKLWPSTPSKSDDSLPGAWIPLAFSKDSRFMAALDLSNTLAFINLKTMEKEDELGLAPVRRRLPSSVSVSSDFRSAAEGTEDGAVRIWSIQAREFTTVQVSARPIGFAQISGNGKQLVAGGFGEPLKWIDVGDGTSVPLGPETHRALFSPDNRTLAVLTRNEGLSLWEVASRSFRTNISLETPPGFAAAFSPDSRFLALASGINSSEDVIWIIDTLRGRLAGTCTGHKQAVFSLAFSPDGRTLASSSDDSTLKMWNVSTRQELLTIRRLGAALNSLMFSPDGHWLVGASGFFGQAPKLRFHYAPLLDEIDLAVTLAQLGE